MDELHFIDEAVHFLSEGLQLEGVLSYPAEREPTQAVLLLSPHPHMGGEMNNNVVRHLARRLAEDGAAALRFNYRGVGVSAIELVDGESLFHHWADMEKHLRYEEVLPDARNALRTLAEAVPAAARISVVGYSLGALLAGMLGPEINADGVVVGIGPPVNRTSLSAFAACPQHKVFVAGDQDFAADANTLRAEVDRLPEPKTLFILEGHDHFFRKTEESLYRLLLPYLLPDAPPGVPSSQSQGCRGASRSIWNDQKMVY